VPNQVAGRSGLAGRELIPNPAHLLNMTDDTGMFQHCRYTIPDRRHGYTLDDNVRALIVAARSADPALLARLPVYLSFVMYCQRSDGFFRNFMGYNRDFLEEAGSPDSQGRALWALGVLFAERPEYRPLAGEMIKALLPHLRQLHYPRTWAFAILGLGAYLQMAPEKEGWTELERLADKLVESWEQTSKAGDWLWFEDFLSYENARLPQALFIAHQVTGKPSYLTIARQAVDFLEKIQFQKGYLKLVGNKGWYYRGQPMAEFDEQPVDAGALVEMYNTAYHVTGQSHYAELAGRAFDWYWGWNCHNQAMYDPLNGGCYDGLLANGVNWNQGAESVLSYHLALQSMLQP
jgi:hypothetical protein